MTGTQKGLTVAGIVVVAWLLSRTSANAAVRTAQQRTMIPSATRPPTPVGARTASPTGFGQLGAVGTTIGGLISGLANLFKTNAAANPLGSGGKPSASVGGSSGGGNQGPAYQNVSRNPNPWSPDGTFVGQSQVTTAPTPSTYVDLSGNVAYWDPNGGYKDENGQPVTIDASGQITLDPLASTDQTYDPTFYTNPNTSPGLFLDQGSGDTQGLIADALANPPSGPDTFDPNANNSGQQPGDPNVDGSVFSFSDAASADSGILPSTQYSQADLAIVPTDPAVMGDSGFDTTGYVADASSYDGSAGDGF